MPTAEGFRDGSA